MRAAMEKMWNKGKERKNIFIIDKNNCRTFFSNLKGNFYLAYLCIYIGTKKDHGVFKILEMIISRN